MENTFNIEELFNSKVIAVVRNCEMKNIYPLVNSLLEGGIDAIEITMEQPNALKKLSNLNELFGDYIKIGAGTVTNSKIALSAINLGAKYIVSPNFNSDVIRVCNNNQVIVIPGAFTPSEILNAYEYGADAVKIFPASVLGANYIKQIKAPIPDIPLIATGGINEENIKRYFLAGVKAVGIGGDLVNEESEIIDIKNMAERLIRIARSVE